MEPLKWKGTLSFKVGLAELQPVGQFSLPPAFINTILLEYRYAFFVCIIPRAVFALQWQRVVVVTETTGSTNLKYL